MRIVFVSATLTAAESAKKSFSLRNGPALRACCLRLPIQEKFIYKNSQIRYKNNTGGGTHASGAHSNGSEIIITLSANENRTSRVGTTPALSNT